MRTSTWWVNAIVGGGGTALLLALGLGYLAYLFWAASPDARLLAVVLGAVGQNIAEGGSWTRP